MGPCVMGPYVILVGSVLWAPLLCVVYVCVYMYIYIHTVQIKAPYSGPWFGL